MKVVTGETMQWMDRRTIEEFGVAGLTLMENAGRGCVEAILARFAPCAGNCAVVVAGKGNNGGDGYVIARLLRDEGWSVTTVVLASRADIGGDAAVNLDKLDPLSVIFSPAPDGLRPHAPLLKRATVVVDAILGTGLKSAVAGVYQEAVGLINACGRPVVSVDIPSGIDATTGRVLGMAIKADLTVTFAAAKVGEVLFPGCEYCGKLAVVDIGIPPTLLGEAPGFEFLDEGAIRPLLRRRPRTSHKGSFGHVLIVAGSTGKTGAAAMAANSAVRGGAGLVSLAGPASLNPILEVKTTEAMTIPIAEESTGFLGASAEQILTGLAAGKDAVAIGPGISRHPSTATLVQRLVSALPLPLVVDADGLNAVADNLQTLLERRAPAVILTPHPGEMARLTGLSVAEVEADRLAIASEFARRYQVYLLLKGARTVIAAPDGRIAINGSGNPGMASGGTGDVLTGLLTALLGQGYEPFDACKVGVFLHGYAADLVAAETGEIGMSAVDVQEKLPYAFKYFMEQEAHQCVP